MTDPDTATNANGDRFLVVSNRGPVQFARRAGQRVEGRPGGGLISALAGVRELDRSLWICAPMSAEDDVVAAEMSGRHLRVGDAELRFVELDPGARDRSYSVIANPMLWFVQHQLWNLGSTPVIGAEEWHAYENGYVPVNQRFAETILKEMAAGEGRCVVLLHDYHLYLVAAALREARPDALIHHFVHIPWPPPEAWRILPARIREALINGLLGSNVVGFHTERYASNFLDTCEQLLGLPVDRHQNTVTVGRRRVAVRWYPISIAQEPLERLARTAAVARHRRALAELGAERLIVRVDRADPSKNILRGFLAYELLLERHAWLVGRVTFLALLQPTRSALREYAHYLRDTKSLVARINARFGDPEWTPIRLVLGESMTRTVAAYQAYDVLLVNAVADGMNLVAKEGALLNDNDGVLVLSETVGAAQELGAFAISVNPYDISEQADALYRGLVMEPHERRERGAACRAVVRHNSLRRWFDEQLLDLEQAVYVEESAASTEGKIGMMASI